MKNQLSQRLHPNSHNPLRVSWTASVLLLPNYPTCNRLWRSMLEDFKCCGDLLMSADTAELLGDIDIFKDTRKEAIESAETHV